MDEMFSPILLGSFFLMFALLSMLVGIRDRNLISLTKASLWLGVSVTFFLHEVNPPLASEIVAVVSSLNR